MFRIVCDPSSRSIELYLIEITRSGSLMFVVCLVDISSSSYMALQLFYRVLAFSTRFPSILSYPVREFSS